MLEVEKDWQKNVIVVPEMELVPDKILEAPR
jgi:hypothetical protein